VSKPQQKLKAKHFTFRFFSFCEAQGAYYVNPAMGIRRFDNATLLQCCGDFFNPEPFFTLAGTCFSSNIELHESNAATYSSVKIWVNKNKTDAPGKQCRTYP